MYQHVDIHVKEIPHNAPFDTCTYVRTEVDELKNVHLDPLMSVGHVSIRESNEVHFHRGHYQAARHLGARS